MVRSISHPTFNIQCTIYVRIPRSSRQRASEVSSLSDSILTVSRLFRQSEHNYLDTSDVMMFFFCFLLNIHACMWNLSSLFGFYRSDLADMLARIFILFALFEVCYCKYCGCRGTWNFKNVDNCEECEEKLCKMGNDCGEIIDGDCYWESYINTCLKAGGILGSLEASCCYNILPFYFRWSESSCALWRKKEGYPLW